MIDTSKTYFVFAHKYPNIDIYFDNEGNKCDKAKYMTRAEAFKVFANALMELDWEYGVKVISRYPPCWDFHVVCDKTAGN